MATIETPAAGADSRLELVTLEAFHAVVECGGFTAAARRLDTSKSVVSRRVAELEESLGVRLLHRSTRRVTTTEAGARYFQRSRAILADLVAAGDEVAASGRGLHGTLRIAAPMSFGTLQLAAALAPFLRQHPGLEVAVDLDDRRVDFQGGGYDLAIRVGVLEGGQFVARRLADSPAVLVASPDYLAAAGRPRVPADLLRHQFLGYAYATGSQTLNFRPVGGRAALSLRVRPRMVANNGEFNLVAAGAGLGIAAVPDWMLVSPAAAGLETVLDDWPLKGGDVYALYPRARQPSLRVRALVDHLAATFADGLLHRPSRDPERATSAPIRSSNSRSRTSSD